MATNVSGEFEGALKRLEEIVQRLERENVGLDESVALFKEGKALSQKCERLLKDAQTSIESAARADAPEAVPAAPAVSPAVSPGRNAAASLFTEPVVDDDPDL